MDIVLPNGRGVAIIDDEDWDLVSKYKWNWSSGYAATNFHDKGKHVHLYLHRLIMNAQSGQIVDHIDHNKLYCRRSNLRFCTRSQNNMNFLKRINTYSKFKGVVFDFRRKKWSARIKINRRTIYLGSFVAETDAAEAYEVAAKELFGEFACTGVA